MLFVLLLWSFPSIILAQHHWLGTVLGIDITNKADYAVPNKVGFIGGLTYGYQAHQNFVFEANLLYNQRGFQQDYQFRDVNGKVMYHERVVYGFNYLSLPLKLSCRTDDPLHLIANVGVLPSVLLQAATSSLTKPPIERNKVSFDLGVIAELGIGYTLYKNVSFYALAGVQRTFWTVNPNMSRNKTISHYGWDFSLGFRYILEKEVKADTPVQLQSPRV